MEPKQRKVLDLLRRLFETGAVKPVIDRHYRLGEVRAALEYVADGRARGKVVVTMGQI